MQISLEPYQQFFSEEWDSINAKRGYPWKENHWIWAIKFKIHEIFK